MYGYGFLSRGFTDRREILHGGLATYQTGLLLFWGIASGMAEFWASAGAIWLDMFLAEAFVHLILLSRSSSLESRVGLPHFTGLWSKCVTCLTTALMLTGQQRSKVTIISENIDGFIWEFPKFIEGDKIAAFWIFQC